MPAWYQSLISMPGSVTMPAKPITAAIVASQAPRPRTSGATISAVPIQNAYAQW